MSVKVGVRVRPYNQRQKDLNCRLCVDMMGPKTRLFDADDPQKHRDFTFDYSFWSHDQFYTDERGYFTGETQKYADQQHVFQQVGLQILSNAWQGYHCCLFAYGQTGAGKSYSMVGYGINKGIVPISCQQIFRRIQNNEDKNKQYEINVSMLEIYNQKVQDLLVPINKRNKDGYKIREHKTLGIYVQNLSKHYVDTYVAIEQKMNEGSSNRSIAATEMNASSSRAHTIISIQFRQKQLVQGKKRQKLSVIHLVDLAGSQKVGKTGATGDRLKQAAGINKSLSVLGLVISTLADKALGKGKGVVVPYRDSCLTRILQNALGGNSKTLMICAISPATDNYEQTLSTLRYADQAKKIQNKAVVNQSETDKMIRNLTAQKDELKDKVAKFEEMFKKISQGFGIDPEKMKQFNETQEQLRFNTQMMKGYSMTKTQKLQHKQEMQKNNQSSIKKVDTSKPHFSNLNQDPQLSRRINYPIFQQKTTIGRRNSEPQNNIQIGGMGIRSLHAIITKNQQNQIFMQPIFTSGDSSCFLNGDTITQKIQLMNLDRIIFGTNNFFIVILPQQKCRDEIEQIKIDWQFAQNQMYIKKQQIQKQQTEQRQKKIKQEAEAILKEKQNQLAELHKKLQENEEMRKNLEVKKQIQRVQLERKLREQQAQKLRQQIEKNKRKIKDSQTLKKQRIKDKYMFQKKLTKSLPKCIQLNLIAKQFKKNINLSVKMLMHSEDQQEEVQIKKRSMKVKVTNYDDGYIYWWDSEKLSNRYYIIKDMAQTYFQTGMLPQLQKKDDPFWDPPEPTLIGKSFLTTKALAYLFDNKVTLSIIGENDQCGDLIVNMIPSDESGQKNLSQELDQQQLECEPQQLVGKPFYYNMIIESALIPNNFSNIYVQYNMKTSITKQETFKTQEVQQKTQNPIFNYKYLHIFPNLTQALLEYLLNARIVYKIYGVQVMPIKIQQKQQKSSQQLTDNTQSNTNVDKKPKKKKNGSSKKKSTDKKKPQIQQKQQKNYYKQAQNSNLTDQSRAKNQSQKEKNKEQKSKEQKSKEQKNKEQKKIGLVKKNKESKQDCKIF